MNNTINTQLFGNAPKTIQQGMEGVFSFNGWNLDNGRSIRVIASNHDDIGTIDFETYKTPLQDGGGVLGKYYRKKTIQFTLSVNADTLDSFNDLIDEIKFQTSKTEGSLKIVINNIVREWTATCTSLKFNRKNINVNWCGDVQLIFTCINPHSHLVTPQSVNIVSETGTYQSGVMYEGRAETYPSLYITMDSGSSTGMRFALNDYVIEINTSLTAGDIIIFNGETKTVTVNDVEVGYTGPFTPIVYGENIFEVYNAGTYTGTLSYYTRYL